MVCMVTPAVRVMVRWFGVSVDVACMLYMLR